MDGDFCTVSQVKHLLPVSKSQTGDDPLIQRLITGCSTTVRNWIGDALNSKDYTEVRDGTGTGKLILRHQPVTAVASVSLGPPSGRSALVVDRDYVWTTYAIQLLAGSFPKGVANVAVVYTAGYVAIPADIADNVAKVVALRYKEAERLGQSSKTLGAETINFDLSDFPRDVKLALGQYKRVAQISR